MLQDKRRHTGFNLFFGPRIKKTDADDKIPCFLEPVVSLKTERPELTGKTFCCYPSPGVTQPYQP